MPFPLCRPFSSRVYVSNTLHTRFDAAHRLKTLVAPRALWKQGFSQEVHSLLFPASPQRSSSLAALINGHQPFQSQAPLISVSSSQSINLESLSGIISLFLGLSPDVLISLKKLVMQRAKVIGHENLIEKFDVKLLRALGVVLLEYIKERVQSSSAFSTHPEVSTILNQCRLSTTSPEAGVSSVVADEVSKKIDSFMKQEKMDED